MAGAANCWLSPPHRWCSRPADGHLVDCCLEGVPLAGVVVANQCLCQLETEGLHTLSAPASSWPALPHQDEGVCDAAIHKEPEDVPVVSKLHSHLCMTETMYLCIHELIHFLFTECVLLFVFTKDGHHSLIKLVAFRANPIIATQLVGLINATHVPVVEGNTFRTGNVAGTAVPSLATNSGG